MKNGAISFNELRTKLEAFDFSVHSYELDDGRRGRIFMRMKEPKTNIYLPEYADDDMVDSYHLADVLATLKTHGLIEEANPLLT